MSNQIKNIFIGLTNISSVYNDLKYGFNHYGVNTQTAIFENQNKTVEGEYDLILHDRLPDLIRYLLHFDVSFSLARKAARRITFEILYPIFLKSYYNKVLQGEIERNDAFIFIWNSFFRDNSDLEIIHNSKKKIIQIFCGDDVRWFHGIKQEFEILGFPMIHYDDNYNFRLKYFPIAELKLRLNRIKNAERYADVIFNKREQAQICSRPFYHYPMFLNLDNFSFLPIQRKKPLIIHAPSNPVLKGTSTILKALEKLRHDGIDFDFQLIQNMPNRKTLELISSADIVIDQLYLPGGGRLTSEGLAFGKVVISCMYYEEYFQADYYKDCPVIDANIHSFYEVLKNTIQDIDKRKKIVYKSREWAEKNLDVRFFCKKTLDLMEGKDIPEEYNPTFFKEKFISESEEADKEYKKYIDFVGGRQT